MKLLYCQVCGDVVAPSPDYRKRRTCECGRHAVWWADAKRLALSVSDLQSEGAQPAEPQAYIVTIANQFLNSPDELNAKAIKQIIGQYAPEHPFRRCRSPAARFRPGEGRLTAWTKC